MKHIDLYTDGACSCNPGIGGWGCILIYQSVQKEFSGGEMETTNNRMELTAVIEGLKKLKEPCEVTIYSDSQILVSAFNEKWILKWITTNWKNVKNVDLWKELLDAKADHKVNFVKVKGHADNPLNNRCDYLATSFVKKLQSQSIEFDKLIK